MNQRMLREIGDCALCLLSLFLFQGTLILIAYLIHRRV